MSILLVSGKDFQRNQLDSFDLTHFTNLGKELLKDFLACLVWLQLAIIDPTLFNSLGRELP